MTATPENVRTASAPSRDSAQSDHLTVIVPQSGWRLIDWRELYQYRDLFFFLVWRGIRARYAQSAIGIGWAIIQPVFSMLVFTVVFGRLANIASDGVPYPVFSLAGLVPWTFFSNALTAGSTSLVASSGMLSKVYFPRLILPLSAVASKLVDFAVALLLLGVLMAAYGIVPGPAVLVLPLLIALMLLTAVGLGTWLTALAVQYRDIQHASAFMVQLLMYAAPVVYPLSYVPTSYRIAGITLNPQHLYALNPMVAVIDGFRSALLGTHPLRWDLIAIGTFTATALAWSGLMYFRSREHVFADVV